MRPSRLSLYEMFEMTRRYVVPLFQRPYVWEQDEQLAPLWQDIAGRAEAVLDREARGSRSDRIENHFLGAVVLNPITVYGRQIRAVEVYKEAWAMMKPEFLPIFAIVIIGMIVGSVIPIVLMGPMMIGVFMCLLDKVDGRRASFDKLFKGFDQAALALSFAAANPPMRLSAIKGKAKIRSECSSVMKRPRTSSTNRTPPMNGSSSSWLKRWP